MAKNKQNISKYSKQLWFFGAIILTLWTVFVSVSILWNLKQLNTFIIDAANTEAKSLFQTHVIYRAWNSKHGGVYAAVNKDTQPNPYLKIEERDILTPSGQLLTKINPAYMTRQATQIAYKEQGILWHLTSLKPLRPENRPDAWEKNALKTFESGAKESSSIELINGVDHLRYMQPLITQESCLACHREQGYKVGEIRGGISVSIPMTDYYQIGASNRRMIWGMHGILFLIGTGLTLFMVFTLNIQIRKRILAEQALLDKSKLDGVVEMARAVCHKMNQPLQMIVGNTEILLLDDIDETTRKKRLELIKDQVESMGKMTRQLLKITSYKTIDLPQGTVIDIDESSRKDS